MSLQRTTRIGIGVVALLAVAVAGLGVYAYMHRAGAPKAAAGGNAVTITAKSCEPNDLTVEAGRVTFQVEERQRPRPGVGDPARRDGGGGAREHRPRLHPEPDRQAGAGRLRRSPAAC